MPDRTLYVLKPLLSELAEKPYTIEAADADEIALIEESMKDYETNPSSWIPLESIE
jgi:hypothetical protein